MIDPETARPRGLGDWRAALESEKAQLLDQLAVADALTDQYRALADEEGRENQDLRTDVRALGERCRQLETALAEIRDYPWSDPRVNVLRHIARAALGDTPLSEAIRAELLGTGTAVGMEPPQPSPEETAAWVKSVQDIVEPPQPETAP